jgi:hypothetical protein
MAEETTGSIANHLRDWREATTALETSQRALRAAQAAVSAALVAAEAAETTAIDSELARQAVLQAAATARAAADAARNAAIKAGVEVAELEVEVIEAESAEESARTRHHEAQQAAYRRHGYTSGQEELDPAAS